MSLISTPLLLAGGGGYQISRSVRLRSSASAYFQRTNGTTGTDPLKFTVSGWMKRGLSSAAYFPLLGSDTGTGAFDFIGFENDNFSFRVRNSSAVDLVRIVSSAVYRDFAAWYHIVAVYDSANATSTERVKLYVNGVQITAFGTATYPAQNQVLTGTFLTNMQIGRTNTSNVNQNYGDGYLTEINFIDGQALTPSSFGATNTVTGVWAPKKYTGTYGTNGFYLNFSDNSAATATTIGKDYSGNGNNWTPNNISVTAGSTYDSMIDTPTPYADGGNGRGNYCVLNPLVEIGNETFSNANLTATTGTVGGVIASIELTNDKWYAEFTINIRGALAARQVGIFKYDSGEPVSTFIDECVAYLPSGQKYINNTLSSYGASYTVNDIIGVALDLTANTVEFYKNGVSQGVINTTLSKPAGTSWVFGSAAGGNTNSSLDANFGQRPFSYTPPTGFKALNTQNLPASTIVNGAAYMAATLYTGTGANRSVSNAVDGVSFQPDWVWIKSRSNAYSHKLYDAVRGATLALRSDTTGAEEVISNSLTSFDSNGFTIGGNDTGTNGSGATFVAWQWKANGTPAVTNTAGSITSQVSAGVTQGFSVVTASASGTSPVTVGHGLGVAPRLIIGKVRDVAGTNWYVYSASIAAGDYLVLNSTAAKATSSNIWDIAPTSTVFTVGNPQNGWAAGSAGSKTYVFYCFSEVAGFSKFGSYTGNANANGPFVFCGFRPRFVLFKNASDGTRSWYIYDSARDTYNVTGNYLLPNLSNAEATTTTMDFLSNGFKIRDAAAYANGSGNTIIYAAFAENPFKNALAR